MRQLSANSGKLEEAARREAAEQSLRVTQLSIVREISRTIVEQLDPQRLAASVTEQLRTALGYDKVEIVPEPPQSADKGPPTVMTCAIQDGGGLLGYLLIDNRPSRRVIDPRERELLERSEEHTSELQSLTNLVCRLLLEKKKKKEVNNNTTQQAQQKNRRPHKKTQIKRRYQQNISYNEYTTTILDHTLRSNHRNDSAIIL